MVGRLLSDKAAGACVWRGGGGHRGGVRPPSRLRAPAQAATAAARCGPAGYPARRRGGPHASLAASQPRPPPGHRRPRGEPALGQAGQEPRFRLRRDSASHARPCLRAGFLDGQPARPAAAGRPATPACRPCAGCGRACADPTAALRTPFPGLQAPRRGRGPIPPRAWQINTTARRRRATSRPHPAPGTAEPSGEFPARRGAAAVSCAHHGPRQRPRPRRRRGERDIPSTPPRREANTAAGVGSAASAFCSPPPPPPPPPLPPPRSVTGSVSGHPRRGSTHGRSNVTAAGSFWSMAACRADSEWSDYLAL